MFSFNRNYFLLTALLLLIEVYIALYVHDQLIRPYGGDLLVVILLYCAVKSFTDLQVWRVGLAVLLFSYLAEALQYFNIVQHLGLGNSNLARVIIGTSFAWADLLAYTLGIALVLLLEQLAQGHAVNADVKKDSFNKSTGQF